MDIGKALEHELAQAKKQVNALGKALQAFRSSLTKGAKGGRKGGTRVMSAAARRKISQAQKARWAKQKAAKN